MPQPPLIRAKSCSATPSACSCAFAGRRQYRLIPPLDGVLNVWVSSREGGDDRPVTRDTPGESPLFLGLRRRAYLHRSGQERRRELALYAVA